METKVCITSMQFPNSVFTISIQYFSKNFNCTSVSLNKYNGKHIMECQIYWLSHIFFIVHGGKNNHAPLLPWSLHVIYKLVVYLMFKALARYYYSWRIYCMDIEMIICLSVVFFCMFDLVSVFRNHSIKVVSKCQTLIRQWKRSITICKLCPVLLWLLL
jgi:hypothetical protein